MLDRFFISKNFLLGSLIVKTWVEVGGLSDHLPIILQLESPKSKSANMFKFNPTWLVDDEFNSLVKSLWVLLQEEV